MSDRQQTYAKVVELIAPFNKKGVAITEAGPQILTAEALLLR